MATSTVLSYPCNRPSTTPHSTRCSLTPTRHTFRKNNRRSKARAVSWPTHLQTHTCPLWVRFPRVPEQDGRNGARSLCGRVPCPLGSCSGSWLAVLLLC